MAGNINYAKRNRQFARLQKYKSKLTVRDYNLIKNWITNWEFMGDRGDVNLTLNLRAKAKK